MLARLPNRNFDPPTLVSSHAGENLVSVLPKWQVNWPKGATSPVGHLRHLLDRQGTALVGGGAGGGEG